MKACCLHFVEGLGSSLSARFWVSGFLGALEVGGSGLTGLSVGLVWGLSPAGFMEWHDVDRIRSLRRLFPDCKIVRKLSGNGAQGLGFLAPVDFNKRKACCAPKTHSKHIPYKA